MLIGTKKKKLGKIERWAVGKETYLKVDFSAIQPSYRVKHSKRNSISMRAHLSFSIYQIKKFYKSWFLKKFT